MTQLTYTNIFDVLTDDEGEAADLEFRADLLLVIRQIIVPQHPRRCSIKCRTLNFLSSKQAYEVLTEIFPAGPEFCEYSARVEASFGESTLFGLNHTQPQCGRRCP